MSFDAIYHAEPVETGEWEGFRILSHEDTVYTAVTDGEAEARLYGDPQDGWTAAVRFPVADDDEAYDVWDETATSLTPEEAALQVDGLTFQNQREGGLERTGDGYTLRYNPDGRVAFPQYSYERLDSGSLAEAGIFLGWIPGLAGPAVDPSGTGAGPAILAGAWLGTIVGLPAANKALTKTAGTINTWRSKRKYGDPGRLQDASLLHQVNERNALEQYLEQEGFDSAYGDTYEDLAEKDLDATLEKLTETHFDRFPEQQGVVVSTRTETYDEAADLLSTVSSPYTGERPRVIDDPDAFHSIFSHLARDGTVLEDGRDLVRRVLEEDADPDIEAFLDTEYEDVVRAVGAETRLND